MDWDERATRELTELQGIITRQTNASTQAKGFFIAGTCILIALIVLAALIKG